MVCINLRRARKFFTYADGNKLFLTICLPFGFKISRKALAYLRNRRVTLVSHIQSIEEVYVNGDPKELILEGDKNSYTLTSGFVNYE